MKATSILFVLLAMATAAVVVAEPARSVSSLRASSLDFEPVWMLLSGATLLFLAGIVRRYVP